MNILTSRTLEGKGRISAFSLAVFFFLSFITPATYAGLIVNQVTLSPNEIDTPNGIPLSGGFTQPVSFEALIKVTNNWDSAIQITSLDFTLFEIDGFFDDTIIPSTNVPAMPNIMLDPMAMTILDLDFTATAAQLNTGCGPPGCGALGPRLDEGFDLEFGIRGNINFFHKTTLDIGKDPFSSISEPGIIALIGLGLVGLLGLGRRQQVR